MKKPDETDADVITKFEAVQLVRGTRLAWSPTKVISDELVRSTDTISIEYRRSFPGIVIINHDAPPSRACVTRIPWPAVVAVHG